MKKPLCFLLSVIFSMECYSQSFVNPSLESWAAAGICETNTPPDGWTDYSNIGIGPDEGTLTLCPSTIPPSAADGNTYARCLAGNPTTGEGMYQVVSGFIQGNSYSISYRFCGSNLWGGSGDCVWHLFIDDVDVNQSAVFSSGNPAWQTNYFTFTATLTTHKIGLRAYTPTFNGGGSAAIDNFSISESKPTAVEEDVVVSDISLFPNPVTNQFTIYDLRVTILKIEIYNVLGERVYSGQHETSNQEHVTVNVSTLTLGIYFADVLLDNGSVKRIKFIKE